MVAPTLRYDEPVVEGDQLLVLVLADELHVVQLLGVRAKIGAFGPGGHGLDQRLVCMVSIGRGQQRAEPAVVCERCEEIGLLLKNRMVRALKLLSLRYLRYLSWKAKDVR